MLAWRDVVLAALVCALGSACSGDSRDLLVERCTNVIHYRNPTWKDVEIRDVRRGPGANAVEFGFEAVDEPSGAKMESRIACEFESGRWSVVAVRFDGQQLTEAELALVNSEFLLRDLSESPERLEGHS